MKGIAEKDFFREIAKKLTKHLKSRNRGVQLDWKLGRDCALTQQSLFYYVGNIDFEIFPYISKKVP